MNNTNKAALLGRGEAEMLALRQRHDAARQIASKLGVSVERVFVEWREAEQRQREWMKTLSALGYNQEDPLTFLRRINANPEPENR